MRRKPRKRAIELLESRLPLAGFVVTTPEDILDAADGVLSLREAVIAANTNSDVDDEISFAPGIRGRVIEISRLGVDGQDTPETGDLDVTTGQITIKGWGLEETQIDAQDAHRVFQVYSGAALTLSDMSLQNGNAGRGGAVLVLGTLNAHRVRFRDNIASVEGGAIHVAQNGSVELTSLDMKRNSAIDGGAISNEGSLRVQIAHFLGNQATNRGGAIYSSGSSATIDLESVGAFGNSATGGAVIVNDGATAFVVNSSFANNRSDWGGVILNRADDGEQALLTLLQSTLVAGANEKTATVHTASRGNGFSATRVGNTIVNINGNNPTLSTFIESAQSAVEVVSLGHNHFSDSGNGFATASDATGVNLVTDGHMDNQVTFRGGQTQIREIFASSPTIDAGDPLLAVNSEGRQLRDDQREGLSRFVGGQVDIGAFEFQSYSDAELVVTTVEDSSDPDDGLLSLREAINRANAQPDPNTITFSSQLFDGEQNAIVVQHGKLSIRTSMEIIGPGSDMLSIDGGGNTRIFDVWFGEYDVSFKGLTIRGGATFADSTYLEFENAGSAIRSRNSGTITLESAVVERNETSGAYSHGAVSITEGHGVVVDSKFRFNQTHGYRSFGPAVYQYTRTLEIRDSTVAQNSALGPESHGGAVMVEYGELQAFDSQFALNRAAGYAAQGGAIAADDVALTRSVVTQNETNGPYGSGGGIIGDSVVLVDSQITGNFTTGYGANGGGVGSGGQITLTRSLVSDNETRHPDSSGGGLAIGGYIDSGRIELEDSVLTDNRSEQGAELWFSSNNTDNFDIVARLVGDQSLDFTDFDSWQFQTPLDHNGTLYTVVSHQDTPGSRLLIESDRQWRNSIEPSDVNGDGSVSPLDALLIINAIARRQVDGSQSTQLDPPEESMWPYAFVDQNGDGHISPLDALRVINEIARSASVTALSASKIIKSVEAEALNENDFVRDALFSLF